MFRTAALALLLAAAGACGPAWEEAPAPDLTPVAGQIEFSAILWHELGGTGAAPGIEWITGDRLNCGTDGYWDENTTEGPLCVSGGYRAGQEYIQAAIGLGKKPNMAIVAHEFAHVIQFRTGVAQAHVAPWFKADGVYLVGGPVDLAVKAARAAGY